MRFVRGWRSRGKVSAGAVILLSAWTIVLVGMADHATGQHVRVGLFYLVPILWATWRGGRRLGLAVSGLATSVWLVCDLAGRDRYDYALLPYWNGLVTFAVFGAAVFLLSALGEERRTARTCPLTGLLNRRGFFEAAARELERCGRYGRPVSVGFFDCDDFKRINDAAGHEAGDEILARIGEVFRRDLRESDLCGRLGGDEFAVLLPEAGPEAARQAFGKLAATMDADLREASSRVTLSGGVVTYRVPPGSPDELLRRADRLMYRVKKSGKNGMEFEVVDLDGGSSNVEPADRTRAFRSS